MQNIFVRCWNWLRIEIHNLIIKIKYNYKDNSFCNFFKCLCCKEKQCDVRFRIGTRIKYPVKYRSVWGYVETECPKKVATYGMSHSEIYAMFEWYRQKKKTNSEDKNKQK